jgi:hypothetical protein
MTTLPHPVATLALTIGTEWLVYWALLRHIPRNLALYALLINALTQPPANLLYQRFGHFWPIEAGVWLLESALLRAVVPLRPGHALLVSALANGASAAIGLWLY